MIENKIIFYDNNSEKDINSKLGTKISSFNQFCISKRKKILKNFINRLIKNKQFSLKNILNIIKKYILIYIIIFTIKIISRRSNIKLINKTKEISSSKFLMIINPIKFPELYLNFEFNYLKDKYYNITNFQYLFSFVYKTVKVEYNISILDKNKKIISPSDLPLYYDLHIFCHFEIINQNISIYSLANIYENKFFNCIEFFKINEKVKFGIKLLKNESYEYLNLYHFTEETFDYNKNIYKKDDIFSPNYINKSHEILIEMLRKEKLSKNLV